MRVIAGSARRLQLKTVEGMDTRPTQDRIKETLFNMINNDLYGAAFLDLFAGSGAIGIEALSRGAASAVFVDVSPASIDIVNKNLTSTGLIGAARVIKSDYSAFLLKSTDTFDIAFLDPPYKSGVLASALFGTAEKMSDYGVIFCEHPAETGLPDSVGDFKIKRVYKFGTVKV